MWGPGTMARYRYAPSAEGNPAVSNRQPWPTLVFGIAFGYFEAAVVVYLKRLEVLGQIVVGDHPLANSIILVEVGREAA